METNDAERGTTKTCSICRVELPLSDFHKQTKSSDGHQSRCKKCAIELTKNWQTQWPDRVNEKNRIWRHANPEAAAATRKRYNDSHKEERAKYSTARKRP